MIAAVAVRDNLTPKVCREPEPTGKFQIVVKHRGVIFPAMNGQYRKNVRVGAEVDIILKEDQGSGKLTRGIVKDILTKSSFHPHGIKVRLVSGVVGRVKSSTSDEAK